MSLVKILAFDCTNIYPYCQIMINTLFLEVIINFFPPTRRDVGKKSIEFSIAIFFVSVLY